MSRLTEILYFSNNPVAIYRMPDIPEDACAADTKCGIPSLLVRCTESGVKCAAGMEQMRCHGALSGFGFGGIPDRERTARNLARPDTLNEDGTVREGKRFFADPECAMGQIDSLKDYGDGEDAIVFQKLDDAESENRPVEVVVFTVDPARLSALMQLAAYSKRTAGPASIAPFGHACQQIYSIPRAEGESEDPRGVIGMTDMYARRYIGRDMVTYAVPYGLYRRMTDSIPGSFLEAGKYISNLKKALGMDDSD